MKIKLFTHTDLDGIGCSIVAIQAFGEENVDIEYCNYDDVDKKVSDFLQEADQSYDLVFITDISVTEEVAQDIQLANGVQSVFQLLDHHDKALFLNKYEWASVQLEHDALEEARNMVNSSGTSMLFRHLYLQGLVENREITDRLIDIIDFVEMVRRYDTWDWHNIYNDMIPKKLNDLFWIYGRELFIEKILDDVLNTGSQVLSEQDLFVLELEQKKINRYISKCLETFMIRNVGRYKVGIVFGEQYINEVCHTIHDKNPELDLVIMVNMHSRKISYRTNRTDVDVNKFAQYFGGGGRPQTAGSEIKEPLFDDILTKIFG